MSNKKPADEPPKPRTNNTDKCSDDFQRRTDLDGKNDSGPEPEIHSPDIPPQ